MNNQNQILPLPQGEGRGEGKQIIPSPLTGEGEGGGESTSKSGKFPSEQLTWLNKIKDQIAQNAEMTVDDFEYTPFNQEGGLLKARELFGKDLQPIINELNGFLIA